MTEREVMERIRSSAESVRIPEGLAPEWICMKLEEAAHRKKETQGLLKKLRRSKAVAAAAVFVVCGVGIFATCRMLGGPDALNPGNSGSGQNHSDSAQLIAATEERGEEAAAVTSDEAKEPAPPKQDAGNLYTVAKDYGEIYDLLNWEIDYDQYGDMIFVTPEEDGAVNSAAAIQKEEMSTGAVPDSYAMSDMEAERGESASDYTKTNVITEGVDESDIIKTDGSYLYILHEDQVKIIDIRGESMKEAGGISIAMDSSLARVREMYVDGNVLNLILERRESSLRQQEKEQESDTSYISGDGLTAIDVYYMDSDIVTELLTYEIRDKSSPVLKGSVTQDGSYKTSRKIGDIVYVFSETYMEMPDLTRGQALLDENAAGWIPVVNGSAIAADCIYLPDQGRDGLIVASVDVKAPEKTIDQTLILNRSVEIYVSSGSLYLYHPDYSGSGISTQIAKFSLKEGVIDAVGAASAAGQVYDTFAIWEQDGKLRVLTTDQSRSETENQLCLFDSDLTLTGSLKGIAKGEEIYAARFIGDTVYFVTYRNTDPLFAVDLSDEKNPKILSELKITGFSEYLHLWGKDRLFGIGYETDPDTGEQKGIKLTMFDISDPADLQIAGTCVIGNIDYSPALYQYKCVLADPEQNLIGFAAESHQSRDVYSYLLFSWEDGKFQELLTESLGGQNAPEDYRGIYVGDRFYLVSPGEVTAYDREDGYRRTEKLTF